MLPSALLAQQPDEYRPEVSITLPRVGPIAPLLIGEQHLESSGLFPVERTLGVGFTTATLFAATRFVMEARYVTAGATVEHRYVPTAFTTVPLPAGFEIRNRARVELRDVEGAWSQRWQDRAALGHDVELLGRSAFPYVQGDISYDSRFGELNRWERTIGVRVPVIAGASIDVFGTRQIDNRKPAPRLDFWGTILRVTL